MQRKWSQERDSSLSVGEWGLQGFSPATLSTCSMSETVKVHSNAADCVKSVQSYFASDPSQCHAALCVRGFVPFLFPVCEMSGGLLQECIWRNESPVCLWCRGATIIHCVKANLRKIRHTGCIQGNRIEAALPCWIPCGTETCFLDYCIKESVTQDLWGKHAGTIMEARICARHVEFVFLSSPSVYSRLMSDTSPSFACFPAAKWRNWYLFLSNLSYFEFLFF